MRLHIALTQRELGADQICLHEVLNYATLERCEHNQSHETRNRDGEGMREMERGREVERGGGRRRGGGGREVEGEERWRGRRGGGGGEVEGEERWRGRRGGGGGEGEKGGDSGVRRK